MIVIYVMDHISPTPRPTAIEFNNTGIGILKNNGFDNVFDIVLCEYDSVIGENNSENFCDNGCDYPTISNRNTFSTSTSI